MVRASDTLRLKLEQEIGSGTLAPGTTIDEKWLGERFNVSRTPAREAIMQLAAAGVVEIRPRHGAVVLGLDADLAIAMMETLAMLEAEAAGLAARRMNTDEASVLESIYKRSRTYVAETDSANYIDLNAQFHDAIYHGARNEYLASLIRQTRRRMIFYHASSLNQKFRLERSWCEHGRVLEAISAGKADLASEAMRDHILSGGRVYADLVASLKSSGENGSAA